VDWDEHKWNNIHPADGTEPAIVWLTRKRFTHNCDFDLIIAVLVNQLLAWSKLHSTAISVIHLENVMPGM
jgi:hypothetical protein